MYSSQSQILVLLEVPVPPQGQFHLPWRNRGPMHHLLALVAIVRQKVMLVLV